MTHPGYILAAYLAAAIVLLGMVAWVRSTCAPRSAGWSGSKARAEAPAGGVR